MPPPVARQLPGCAANPTEATAARRLPSASATSRAITAQGEVDGIKFARPLRVGLPVLVRGAGRQNSGLYYVQSVTHRISRDDYRQSFSTWRNAVGLTGAEVFIDPLAAGGVTGGFMLDNAYDEASAIENRVYGKYQGTVMNNLDPQEPGSTAGLCSQRCWAKFRPAGRSRACLMAARHRASSRCRPSAPACGSNSRRGDVSTCRSGPVAIGARANCR